MNKKRKILIVDDDATNRKFLNIVLSKKPNIEIIEAENGSDALSKLNEDISLILLDIYMPVMDGIQFMQNLQMSYPQFSSIPIIVLSTDDTKKQEALSWGAKEFVIKPVSPTNLWELISKYI